MRPPNIPFTPGAPPRSTRRVEKPLRARASAVAEPAGPAPTGEGGRIDDSLRPVHRQGRGGPARQRPEEFQPGIRAPLAGQIQDPFGGSAARLFELLLDAHDDLGTEDETRLIREPQDA